MMRAEDRFADERPQPVRQRLRLHGPARRHLLPTARDAAMKPGQGTRWRALAQQQVTRKVQRAV